MALKLIWCRTYLWSCFRFGFKTSKYEPKYNFCLPSSLCDAKNMFDTVALNLKAGCATFWSARIFLAAQEFSQELNAGRSCLKSDRSPFGRAKFEFQSGWWARGYETQPHSRPERFHWLVTHWILSSKLRLGSNFTAPREKWIFRWRSCWREHPLSLSQRSIHSLSLALIGFLSNSLHALDFSPSERGRKMHVSDTRTHLLLISKRKHYSKAAQERDGWMEKSDI